MFHIHSQSCSGGGGGERLKTDERRRDDTSEGGAFIFKICKMKSLLYIFININTFCITLI